VLAIQRQVVEEFVDDQPGEEADIGAPALQHPRRGRGAGEDLGVLDLDERSHVLEYHIAARALGDPLADDLVGLGGQSGDRGVGNIDGLYRHPLGIEEQRRLRALALGLGRTLALEIGDTCHQQGALGDPLGRGCDRGQGWEHGRILPCLRWSRTQLVTQAPAHRLDAFQ
jgi:hypothetical protein